MSDVEGWQNLRGNAFLFGLLRALIPTLLQLVHDRSLGVIGLNTLTLDPVQIKLHPQLEVPHFGKVELLGRHLIKNTPI